MITVDYGVLIRVPAHEVFNFVVNPENDPAWVGFALNARKISPGPIGRGTRFHQTGAVMGFRIPLIWEITEFEPGRRMRGETKSGPAKFWGEYVVETLPAGTWVRKLGKIEFGGMMRMADGMLRGIFQTALEHDMQKLKRLLERQRVQ